MQRATSGAAINGLSTTVKYLRRTTESFAGSGLGTTAKLLRGAAGNDLGTTIKHMQPRTTLAPRPSTCDAKRGNGQFGHKEVPATHNERRRGQRPGHQGQVRGAASIGLGTTLKYLRRTTSGAACNGLGTTIKHMRGAAGSGLGPTTK
jgi:hypothetical protein